MSKVSVPKGWIKLAEFEQLTGLQVKTVKLAISTGKIPAECVRKTTAGPTGTFHINPQPTAVAWYKNLNATHPNTKPTRAALEKYIKTFDRSAVAERRKKENAAKPPGEASLADAQLREARAKAQLKELELAEKLGSLVKKDTVYSQLFTFTRELRDALLAIPDRISDEVIAVTDSRNRVHTTIYDAIAEVLLKLSETKDRTLGE